MKDREKLLFTYDISRGNYGILKFAAEYALQNNGWQPFVQELFDQDNDPNSREGLKKCLGETMYNELQKLR